MSVIVLPGDCRKIIAGFADQSIDAIVTDPPYELGFMGKRWDASGVAYDVDLWAECLRVLKPGGHLLAFGGTRTYHRMTVAIEDAGFEVRDSIHWLYGSGFPKSLDVSKAIDKQRHDRDDVYKVTAWVRERRDAAGITNKDIDAAFGANGMGRHWTDVPPRGKQPAVPTLEQVPTLLDVLGVNADDVPDDIRRLLWDLNGKKGQPGENWAKREVVGTSQWSSSTSHFVVGEDHSQRVTLDITAPATDAARQWQGWGTALKPAHEPIVVARKPLSGTVAANVLEHGTGALNVDGCRVGPPLPSMTYRQPVMNGGRYGDAEEQRTVVTESTGRWPANLILTHAADCEQIGTVSDTFGRGAKGSGGFVGGYESGDGVVWRSVDIPIWQCAPFCPVAALDTQSGTLKSGAPRAGTYAGKTDGPAYGKFGSFDSAEITANEGGASRFFTVTGLDDVTPFLYTAKPSRRERNADGAVDNRHPTVKPLALMRWLVRLVTPPGGTVLDPFAGSGTTLAAAILEGFDAIGCEMTDDYLPIIDGRIAWAEAERAKTDPTLFGDAA